MAPMELHNLKPPAGSRRKRRRVGRGAGSNWGKTSGRGHKGAGQRSGFRRKHGFEGGQMPLARRLPKRGFTNIFRVEYQVVNLTDLTRFEPGEVTLEMLRESGLAKKRDLPVKLLGNGQVEAAYAVKANAFSKSAIEKLESAGGKAEVVS